MTWSRAETVSSTISSPPRAAGALRWQLQSTPVHYIYIVRCVDGTLYTGYALDPHERERQHNRGRGAHYTACRRPVSLVYSESFATKSEALRREHDLKRWRRTRKEALITLNHDL
jgi:putative endonuclease